MKRMISTVIHRIMDKIIINTRVNRLDMSKFKIMDNGFDSTVDSSFFSYKIRYFSDYRTTVFLQPNTKRPEFPFLFCLLLK